MNTFFPYSWSAPLSVSFGTCITRKVMENRHLANVMANFSASAIKVGITINTWRRCIQLQNLCLLDTRMTKGVLYARKSHPTSSLVIDRIPSG
jgi:hypothetical protein